MKWYHYLIIGIVALVIIAGLIFLITYLVSKNNKEKSLKEASLYYVNIINAVGDVSNIIEVNVNSSRLSLVLKDNSLINNEQIEKLKNDGIGIVKSSKKITLVVGEMAPYYQKEINKLINK